jgi:glycosyltransferase involved in cell wall biosynthesis
MACGAPVVTSSVSSMPEVGGDCVCYCDPANVESIAGAMEAVLCDERKRRDMSAGGIERAQGFRWSATAAMVRETLLRLA